MYFKKIIIYLGIILLFLFINSNLLAQYNLRSMGVVVDLLNNQPIAFANIKILSSNEFTTTNTRGEFYFNSNQKHTIEISNIGYATRKIEVNPSSNSEPLIIQLEEQFINVDEVVVTATRSEKMLKDVPVLTQIVSARQMENTGMTSVSEIVNSLKPSVDFYNEGRGMTFRMQGLSAKYTLFLIDGERIAGENRDNIDYSRLTSTNIDRIEIVQGASSSLYGSSAMGGVVNLITRTPRKPFEANIYSRFSKFNEMENGVNLGFKGRKLTFFTDFVRKTTDGYDNSPEETPNYYTLEPFTIYSYFNKLIFDVSEKLQFTARVSAYTKERFDVNTIPKHPFYADLSSGLSAKYKPSERLQITASIYGDIYGTFDVYESLNDSLGRVYSNRQLSPKIIANYNIDSTKIKHHFTAGGEYLYDEIFAIRIEDSTKSSQNYVVFIQDEISINKNLSFTVGTRNDFNSYFGNAFSPKVSAKFSNDKMNYRLTYAQGFRAPSIKERYYDFDLGFISIQGNKNLIPEKSNYFSTSVEYLTSKLNMSSTFYYNILKDMIIEQAVENIYNGYTYKNVSNVNIAGADLILRTRLINQLSIITAYSFTYAKDLNTGELLKGVSKHSATLTIDYFKNFQSNSFGISLSGKMYGEKTYDNQIGTGEIYEDIFPTYSLWKISAIAKLLNNAISLNVGVNNILNFKTEGDLINTDPGRRLFVTINISCDKFYKQIFNK